jgi:hypothetical protein
MEAVLLPVVMWKCGAGGVARCMLTVAGWLQAPLSNLIPRTVGILLIKVRLERIVHRVK